MKSCDNIWIGGKFPLNPTIISHSQGDSEMNVRELMDRLMPPILATMVVCAASTFQDIGEAITPYVFTRWHLALSITIIFCLCYTVCDFIGWVYRLIISASSGK